MAIITPFRAVRPSADKVHLVASRSYVTYKPADLKRKLSENPFSFIHIINPEFDAPKKSPRNSPALFGKVKAKYRSFIDSGFLVQDEKPSLYIYQQITPDATFTGIVCGVSVKDYAAGKIKIHEHTITSREEVFCQYLDICDFNAEPVLLTYTDNKAELKLHLAAKMSERPEYDFTTTDRTRHKIWVINSEDLIEEIVKSFSNVDTLYIADGHHRMASSARLSESRNLTDPGKASSDPLHDYALAMILPCEDLKILPFHRLLKMGDDYSDQQILDLLESEFKITPAQEPVIPDEKRTWGLKLASGWFRLKLKHPYAAHKEADHLDAVIITKKALDPIFGIHDQKTDKRISFIPGNESLTHHEKCIDQGLATALITLHAVSREELLAVADANEIMPPKSTWIAPKLRSGLTIMPLS